MPKTTVQATKRKRGQVLNPEMIRESSTIEQPTIKLKLIGLKLSALTSKLPGVLSSWIGKNPGNIYQIASPEKGTGFNAIAWRDQNSSELYLENLDRFRTVTFDPSSKVTLYPEVQSLAKKSGWKNALPDTIFVKSAGSPKSKMAAKKMVLPLLDSYQSSFPFPNKPVLKETKTDLLGGGESVITFSVKGIPPIEPIMSSDTFIDKYLRGGMSGSLATTVIPALNSYQEKLRAGVVNGFRVEEVAATSGRKGKLPNVAEARRMVQEIEVAANSLQSTINAAIKNKGKTGLTKPELAALSRLRDQVGSAIEDGFRNELDTRRRQQWLTLNPLTEDQLVPGTGKEIGAGVQGAVFKYELDPALARRPVILKYENNGLNEDAKGAGIPELNPQQSVRAVAAFKMSKQLNLDIIPRTEFFVGTDDDGRPKLGQTMEFVNGTVGQRKAGLKNDAFDDAKSQRIKQLEIDYVSNDAEKKKLAQDELLQLTFFQKDGKYYPKAPIDQNKIGKLEADQAIVDKLGNLDPKTLEKDQQGMLKDAQDSLDNYVKVNGEWYYADNLPVNIDYGNRVVQKGLSDLQVFDYIIGHADRNPGNWIYEKDNTGHIIGVKGIDNDDTFGKEWSPGSSAIPKTLGEFSSKTPGVPPIVDISTALSILNADFAKDIQPLLAGLSKEEIDQAAERFDQVQQQVESRVMAGKIASIAPTEDAGVQAKLEALRTLTGAGLSQTLRWGNLGIADTHTETNSYLGFQIAQKAQFGVAPESGVGLALLAA